MSRSLLKQAATLSTLLALAAAGGLAQSPPQPSPAPTAILQAFDQTPIVAIGELHGLQAAGNFYVSLIKTPGFADKVNDVVVEFSTPRYQDLLDRYVNGADIPPAELAQVWRNTTKVFSWESPIYPQLLAAIRDLNRTLPPARRVRVLGGDAPIDWTQVHTNRQWGKFQPNDKAFADIITQQVLARHRKALVILGNNHLTRGGDRNGFANTTSMVEKHYPRSMYIVLLAASGFGEAPFMQSWQPPALAPTNAPWAARVPFGHGTLKNSADAVLYLGPWLREAQPDWNSFDPAYLQELDRRSHIEWGCSFDLNRWKHSLRPCP
jgi:hypothetical protein